MAGWRDEVRKWQNRLDALIAPANLLGMLIVTKDDGYIKVIEKLE